MFHSIFGWFSTKNGYQKTQKNYESRTTLLSLSGKFWKDVDTWRSLEGVVPSGSQSEAGWGWNINRAPAIAPWPPIRPSCTGHHQEGDQGHPGSIMNITTNSIIKPARCLPCRLARRSYQLHLKRLLCGESVRAPGEVEDMLAQFHLRFRFQVLLLCKV